MSVTTARETFWDYQQRKLLPLIGWGLGNMMGAPFFLMSREAHWRRFGLQALVWGTIDLALGLWGRHDARNKRRRFLAGELTNELMLRETFRLYRILRLNTILDVGYIAWGIWYAVSAEELPQRRGAGENVIFQGLFLLLYDALFAHDLRERWLQ